MVCKRGEGACSETGGGGHSKYEDCRQLHTQEAQNETEPTSQPYVYICIHIKTCKKKLLTDRLTV